MKINNVYLISSAEPVLRDDAVRQIEALAKQQGYDTVKRYTVDSQFNWPSFFANTLQNDLFSATQLHILNLNSPKLNADNAATLIEFLAQKNDQHILVISCDKLDAATTKSKWVTAIQQCGSFTQLWPPDPAALPQWLNKRAEKYQLKLSPDALTLIAESSEGNLSAAVQTIEKLFLQYGAATINDEQVYEALYDSSRYTVFDLVDSWLNSDKKHSYKILHSLKAEEAEPTLILWALTAECRTLARISFDLAQNQSLSTALSNYRVWKKREPLVRKHLNGKHNYNILLQQLTSIELIIKGAVKGNFWDEMEGFLIC